MRLHKNNDIVDHRLRDREESVSRNAKVFLARFGTTYKAKFKSTLFI